MRKSVLSKRFASSLVCTKKRKNKVKKSKNWCKKKKMQIQTRVHSCVTVNSSTSKESRPILVQKGFLIETRRLSREQLGSCMRKSVLSKPFASSRVCTKKRKNKVKKSKIWCKQKKTRMRSQLHGCVNLNSLMRKG